MTGTRVTGAAPAAGATAAGVPGTAPAAGVPGSWA
jgi:hypothetical protein